MTDRLRLHHWFRFGYAARGLVFMGLGAIAWSSGRGQSSADVVAALHALPMGSVLLIALVVALAGLGLFRLAEAWLDLDRHGSQASGLLQRVGRGVGALGYFGVAIAALTLFASGARNAAVDRRRHTVDPDWLAASPRRTRRHRIRDVTGVLSAMREHVVVFRMITGGLFLFGAYSLIEAWYRRMRDDDELRDRAEAKLAA